MKRKLLSVFTLTTVFFFSCNKENIEPIEEDLTDEVNITTKANAKYPIFYLNGTTDDPTTHCEGSGGNCLPPVEVNGIIDVDIVDETIDAVNGQNPMDIRYVFTKYSDELIKIMPETIVKGVVKGNYTVENTGDFTEESTAFLQFFDTNEELVQVCQLTK